MSWVQRARFDEGPPGFGPGGTIYVADAQALSPATYSATSNVACVVEDLNAIIALKGITGGIVQQNADGTTALHQTAFSLAFPLNNNGGNTLIATITCAHTAFGPTPLSVTDTNGNVYTEIFNILLAGGLQQLAVFIALGSIAGGINTVTFQSGLGTNFNNPCVAILEYPGGTGKDVAGLVGSATGGPLTVSVTTTHSNDILLNIVGLGPACGAPSPVLTGPTGPGVPPPGWLIINEPATGSPPTGGGYTDRTNYLYLGSGHQNSYTVQMRQRGQATIHLRIRDGDTYAPTRDTQVFLFDQIGTEYILVFAGLIQNIENQYISNHADRFVILNAVSFESILDTVLTTIPKQFFQLTCGEIVKELFNTFELGAPIGLGNIEDGATIELFNTNFDSIASLLDKLATSSQYIWGIDPKTLLLYFQPPFITPAPFTLSTPNVSEIGFGPGWGSINWKNIGNDYRNRQILRISPEAFANSTNFYVGTGQLDFTLSNPCEQVVNAWVTISSPNYSVGTFTGNPSPGDTFTIQYPIGIPQTTWHPLTMYPIDAIIIDPNGFVQKVTVSTGSFRSGIIEPVWNDITEGNTSDGGLTWECVGPQGLGSNTAFTYTYVATLDNTQFGQIKIGATEAETVQNAHYALMAVTGDGLTFGAGISYSLPTWENGIVNTTVIASNQIKCTSKTPGASQGKCLFSWTGTALTFSPTIAAGGASPNGNLGHGQGGTISIAVGVVGTNVAAPGLYYQPGSASVHLATPLDVGSNLQVEYTRAGGGVVQVENTTLVDELAVLTHGTGKYQAIADYSSSLVQVTAADALLLAQQILASFSVAPQRVTFTTYQPGLSAGQALTIAVSRPTGAITTVNGVWVIEEVNAEIEPCERHGLVSGIGHYRYTVSCIDIQQIASYLDFWEGKGGGGGISGGAGGGSPLVSSAGGSTTASPTGIELQVNGADTAVQTELNLTSGAGITVTDLGNGGVEFTAAIGGVNLKTANYAALAADAGKNIVFNDASPCTLTLPNPSPSATWNIFVQNIGAGTLTVARNSLTIDGAAANLTLTTGQGVYIATDGTNYFTERGMVPVLSAAGITGVNYAAGAGTGNAQTAVYSPAVAALTTGLVLLWTPTAANSSTTPTFAPNGLTAKTITKAGGAALVANDLTTTAIACAIYDGTNWELQNPQTGGGGFTNPMTTKGDVIVGATGGTPDRLAVGTNGQVLTARSSATDGVDWETPSYDVIFAYPGAPPNGAVIQLINFTRTVIFPANFTGSRGHCAGNPTATATYTVNKNGSSIGTIVISIAGSFTFTGAGGTFSAGDTLSILTPATDATLADVTITLTGTPS